MTKVNKTSKRPATPKEAAIRAANKAKNESLRAKGEHPKQLRKKENDQLHTDKKHFGGLGRNERRYLLKHLDTDVEKTFLSLLLHADREREAGALREKIRKHKHHAKMVRLAAEKAKAEKAKAEEAEKVKKALAS